MTRKRKVKRRKKKRQSLLGEPMKLLELGITSTVALGAYGMTLEALSKMRK